MLHADKSFKEVLNNDVYMFLGLECFARYFSFSSFLYSCLPTMLSQHALILILASGLKGWTISLVCY